MLDALTTGFDICDKLRAYPQYTTPQRQAAGYETGGDGHARALLSFDSKTAIIRFMKVHFDWIQRDDGTSEFEDYLDSLPDKDAEKLLAIISMVEDHGLVIASRMRWIKKLEDDLYELRSKQGSDIQRTIYFQRIGTEYLITHGFTKKSQKTPRSEIEHAKAMRKKFLEGERHEQD
jgi:phage-related protein